MYSFKYSILKIIQIMFLIFFLFSLQGCLNAAMTGVQAFYNRHGIQQNLNDQYITMKAYQELKQDNKLTDANISVATYNNEVLLAGQVPQYWQKKEAEQIVKRIPDVLHIYDTIVIASPSSTLTRMSDTWITAKIKAKLLASADVDVTKVKVVTENSTVYLMGLLPSEEAEAAIRVASTTTGVTKVINLFSYIKIMRQSVS